MKKNKIDQCPVCNSNKTSEMYPADIDINKLMFTYAKTPQSNRTFRVVRCSYCTHVFCSPIPRNIYKNYEDVIDHEYLRHSRARILNAKFTLSIIKRYVSSGLMLDVGCATGDFLKVARDYGYQVEGLELSKWSSKITRDKDIHVYRENLKSLANRFYKRYDVITMWGVIEHFENPIDEIKYIKKLLKPGGILAIWTGDVNSITSRFLQRRWWYWQGQHIQYFTHSSLNYLAESSGIKHTKTLLYPFLATYELMRNSLKRYRFWPGVLKILRPLFKIKPVWVLHIPGEMFWIGRKSEKL